MSLSQSREELEKINGQVFNLLFQRKKLVFEIQKIKNTDGSYDQKRELALFKKQEAILNGFSSYELYIYSLIIEEQSFQYNEDYPRWSSQFHLLETSSDCLNGTNPLLLALYDKKRYDALKLKEEYLLCNIQK